LLKSINIILLIIFLFLQSKLFFGDSSIFTVLNYSKKIEAKQRELAKLENRNNALMHNISYIKHNVVAIEELARYELGMIKENETYYQVVEPVE
jgi:cell division protein FtsB